LHDKGNMSLSIIDKGGGGYMGRGGFDGGRPERGQMDSEGFQTQTY